MGAGEHGRPVVTRGLRREISADYTGKMLDGSPDERAPAWGREARPLGRRPGTDEYPHKTNPYPHQPIRLLEGGVYWCSHCANWRSWEMGAADSDEFLIGPICDECADNWNKNTVVLEAAE